MKPGASLARNACAWTVVRAVVREVRGSARSRSVVPSLPFPFLPSPSLHPRPRPAPNSLLMQLPWELFDFQFGAPFQRSRKKCCIIIIIIIIIMQPWANNEPFCAQPAACPP